MGNFFNTIVGSWVKALIGTLLVYIMTKGSIYGLDLYDLASFAAISLIPMVIKAFNSTSGFFNTMWGTAVKMFFTAGLSMIVDNGGFTNLDWKVLLNSAVMAAQLVIANAINPSDTRYGVGKE